MAELQGFQWGGQQALDVPHDKPPSTNDGGGLQTCWSNSGAQLDVEDVGEDICQLVYTLS